MPTINQSTPCKARDLKVPPTNAQNFRCSKLCAPNNFLFLLETAGLTHPPIFSRSVLYFPVQPGWLCLYGTSSAVVMKNRGRDIRSPHTNMEWKGPFTDIQSLGCKHIYHYTEPCGESTTYGSVIMTVNKSNSVCQQQERNHHTSSVFVAHQKG